MKVIFIEDVPNVARAGQTRVVADGYARNYLFRRKLAVLANSAAAAAVEAHLKKILKQKAIEEAEMAEMAKVINGTEITLKAKVGENERLYGSVTGADVAEELGKVVGREIDKRKVELTEPIRQVGVYDVTIRFMHDISAIVCVTVMSDEEGAVKPERVTAKAETDGEKAAKKEKKPKAEKKAKKTGAAEETTEAKDEPVAEVKAEKPAKEKKSRSAKAGKTEETSAAVSEEEPPAAEKKEKKPRTAKAKKTEEKAAE